MQADLGLLCRIYPKTRFCMVRPILFFLFLQVGAAISMTYTTGQPIVFVGTGQTYTDLRNLNAKAVVHALLKA